MNKIYLCGILAMAAVASTSCSNEETRVNEPKSDAIEFGTYLGRDAESRASVFTFDNMKTAGFAFLPLTPYNRIFRRIKQ